MGSSRRRCATVPPRGPGWTPPRRRCSAGRANAQRRTPGTPTPTEGDRRAGRRTGAGTTTPLLCRRRAAGRTGGALSRCLRSSVSPPSAGRRLRGPAMHSPLRRATRRMGAGSGPPCRAGWRSAGRGQGGDHHAAAAPKLLNDC